MTMESVMQMATVKKDFSQAPVGAPNRYTGDFKVASHNGEPIAELRLSNFAAAMQPARADGTYALVDRFRIEARMGNTPGEVHSNVSYSFPHLTSRDVNTVVEAWTALKAEI